MKKIDLIHKFEKKFQLTELMAKKIVDLYFFYLMKIFLERKRIEIRGFGSFFVKYYPSRLSQNPKTREVIQAKDRYKVFFKMSPLLKKRLETIDKS